MDIIRRIEDYHLQFVMIMATELTPRDLEFVDSFFRQDISIPEIAELTIATLSSPSGPKS